MSEIFAQPGERVMDAETGKVICRVKHRGRVASRWTCAVSARMEPEPGRLGPQILIEGEWRP